jgi:hypothetical protein
MKAPIRRKEITVAAATARRELAQRVSNGVNVSLYWRQVGNELTLEVYDERLDERFELHVARDRALDAFNHPFAYLAKSRSVAADERVAA